MLSATYASLGSLATTGRVAAADAVTGFFAGSVEALVAVPAAGLAVLVRPVAVLVEGAREERGAVFAVEASAAERVVAGRLAVLVVLEGAIEDLRSVAVVLAGDRVVVAGVMVVLRAAGFLFSSPEVMEPMSGSASEAADLEDNAVLLAAVPGAGRVGGLFKLEPAVVVRAVELVRGRDVVVEARVVADAAVGRRAPVGAVLAVPVASGRRGAAASCLGAAEEVDEGILRRAVVV
jgi:hypothetical protein